MSLLDHAKRELLALGYEPEDRSDGPNKWIQDNILELITVFSAQGHSGSSAPYVANLFHKLARWEPACPLTGKDDEWNECGEGVWQNNRCPHVFKEDGRAYDSTGRVFREPNGSCYTSKGSRVFIEFPYAPKVEYVDVSGKEGG